MSDYIIYDIKMDIEQKLDFDGKVEDEKPVRDYPNHYLGKAIGVNAALVPLTIGAAPFIARVIESALKEVDKGLIEAAKSFGASDFQIIFKVM